MTGRKIRYGFAFGFFSYELIAPCILLIVVNVQTGTPSNPSEALENADIVNTDDAVEVEEVVMVVGGWR